MIRAYNELYLANARRSLANCFDYAANTMEIPLEKFYVMFALSDLARKFEKGDPFIVSGKSGIELALLVIEKNTGVYEYKERVYGTGRSREYWAGWAIAFYQWYSACSFKRLHEEVPISDIMNMYDKYHEMDIMHFVDRMEELRKKRRLETYLRRYREMSGYSQSALARMTGIPLKTLQHYEQGTKSLSKANVSYVLSLARVLGCKPEDLIY